MKLARRQPRRGAAEGELRDRRRGDGAAQAAPDEGSVRVHALRARAQLLLRARRAARSDEGGHLLQEGEPHRSEDGRGAPHARRRAISIKGSRSARRGSTRTRSISSPGTTRRWRASARLYRAEGNRVRAQEMVEKALDARPYDIEMREMLGELLWESAELDRALSRAREGGRGGAAQPAGAAHAGAHLRGQGRDATIWPRSSSASRSSRPRTSRSSSISASAYQRMGDNGKAIGAYEEILKKRSAATSTRSSSSATAIGGTTSPTRRSRAYQKVMKISPQDPRPVLPARRGLRGGGQRQQGGAGVPGRAAVQALPRRGVVEPRRDRVPARRSVEGDVVPVARGGARADAAQGALQLRAPAVGEEGARQARSTS